MRQLLILLITLLTGLHGFGQSEEVKEKINKAKDRFVFDININQALREKENGFDLKGFSAGFGTYFMYDVVIKESPISIAPGIGVAVDNYRHNSQIVFTDSATNFVPFPDSIGYKKSKLGLTYVDIPLELRYRSKPNNKNQQWKLAVGFKFGFLVRSKWKYKGPDYRDIRMDTDENIKFKEFGIPNLERFRYGVTARGGYGPFNLHFYYSLSDIFEAGKGPEITPITFGISINGL